MNQLAIIRKHLKLMGKAYDAIGVPETRKRAGGLIREETMRYEGVEMPSMANSVTSGSPGEVLSVVVVPGGENAPKAKESGFPGVSTTTVNGVTTVYPHDWVDEGERGPGVTVEELEKKPEAEKAPEPVEMVGGWPVVAEIIATGLAPNRRHNRGSLPDGRIVGIERGLGLVWRNGQKYRCRLIRAGGAPLFRTVA